MHYLHSKKNLLKIRQSARLNFLRMIALMLAGAMVTGYAHDAYAIRLTMKRVVFEGAKRSDVLTIVNDSKEDQVYRLGWNNMVMGEAKALTPFDAGPADTTAVDPDRGMTRFRLIMVRVLQMIWSFLHRVGS